MNYIELLTQEEKVNLCGIMGEEISKNYSNTTNENFKKYEKDSGPNL
jgi:hypothetical protein